MATATLLPEPRQQFVDANGVPLVGGKIYTYIPSTTTPKTTWQDSSEGVMNTNPIVLDSLGTAQIYGNGQYRFLINDADGNLIYDALTQDTLGFLSPQTTPTNGSALIGFLQPNGVGRTLYSKLLDLSFGVKDLGAVGDGVADDTIAIQNALNYLNTYGGTLYFPAGKYRITSALSITFTFTANQDINRPSIKGDGPGNTQIQWDGINDPTVFMMTIKRVETVDSPALHAHSVISGIAFIPINTGKNQYVSGLKLIKWAFIHVRDMWFQALGYGLWADQVITSYFEKIECLNNNYGANFLGAPSSAEAGDIYPDNANTFTSCVMGSNLLGGMLYTDGGFTYQGGSIEGNGQSGTAGSGYGLKIIESVNAIGSPIGCKVSTYFEANGTSGNFGSNASTANVWIVHQTTSDNVIYIFDGCNFNQVGTTYAPYGIYIDKQSASAVGLSVLAAFMDYGGYSADSSRKYIKIATTNASSLKDVNTFYSPANYYNQPTQLPEQVAGTLYKPGSTPGVGRLKTYSCLVIQGAAQGIPSNAATALIWASTVTTTSGDDGVAMWTVTNPTKIFIPIGASRIIISANIRYVADATANVQYLIFPRINGANFSGQPLQQVLNPTTNLNHSLNLSSGPIPVNGASGDYVELYTLQNTGGTLNTDYVATPQNTWLSVQILE